MIRRLIVLLLLLALIPAAVPVPAAAAPPRGGCTPTPPALGCTVFLAANDQVSLAGNSEDWMNPFTKLWFVPAGEGTFGQLYVGYEDFMPQGGMNEQGLFFDELAAPLVSPPPDTDLPDVPPDALSVLLATCADVPCVVDYLNQHDRTPLVSGQLFFGDVSGDAVIVEPRTMIRKSGAFLVATNFYLSDTPPDEITCNRYKTAQAMLTEANGDFSVDLFRRILEATYQEGADPTLYSYIFDLKAGSMLLYLFHDYEHVVEINLADELAQGMHGYDIRALFPDNPAEAAFHDQAWQRYQSFLTSAGYAPDTDSSRFPSYVGRYSMPASLVEAGAARADDYLTVTLQNGLLYYDLPGDVTLPMPLYPTSPTTFFTASFNMNAILFQAKFELDSTGQVEGLMGDFGGMPRFFERAP